MLRTPVRPDAEGRRSLDYVTSRIGSRVRFEIFDAYSGETLFASRLFPTEEAADAAALKMIRQSSLSAE